MSFDPPTDAETKAAASQQTFWRHWLEKCVTAIIFLSMMGCAILIYAGYRAEAGLLLLTALMIVASWRFFMRRTSKEPERGVGDTTYDCGVEPMERSLGYTEFESSSHAGPHGESSSGEGNSDPSAAD